MLNIVELEKRWFRYKLLSYLPYAVIAVALLIIFSLLFYFFSTSEPLEQGEKEITPPPHIVQEEVKPAPVEEHKEVRQPKATRTQYHPPKQQEQYEQVKLSPSLDFMKKMQNAQQPQYRVIQPKQKVAPAPKIKVQKRELPKVEPVVQKEEHKISIKRQNTQNDIFEIITRFKKNNNPALSLFVAKKYYELQDYKQAYNYALITNSINKNIESSWIIFAKSLVKLGKKDQAIQTLRKYIKQSHSNSARILLDEIKSGKFR
jgi:tetratricopeptide (TPR) repeat protein